MSRLPTTDERTTGGVAARRELARLTRAGEVVVRQTSPSAVAGVVALHTGKMTDADRVMVGWIEDDDFHTQAVAEHGRLAEKAVGEGAELLAAGVALRTQRPAVSADRIAVPALDHHGRVTAVVVEGSTRSPQPPAWGCSAYGSGWTCWAASSGWRPGRVAPPSTSAFR